MTEIAFFESGTPDRPVLVLGHALGIDHHVWDEVTPLLANDFHIIAWDQPGHGDSELPTGERTITAVAAALLEGLTKRSVSAAHVAGISLGGMVSLAVAQIAPQRVLSLSILDAGPRLQPASAWTERATQVRAEGMASLVDATMDRWFAPEIRSSAEFERTRETFLACNPEGYARSCEVIASTDLTPNLGEVTMPTLVLTGEDDAGNSPEQAADLARAIPGAGDPVTIAGSRHLTCIHAPGQVAEAVRAVTSRTSA